jgi:hypothetical protein
MPFTGMRRPGWERNNARAALNQGLGNGLARRVKGAEWPKFKDERRTADSGLRLQSDGRALISGFDQSAVGLASAQAMPFPAESSLWAVHCAGQRRRPHQLRAETQHTLYDH